eukprot:scaffold16444_cov29-Tisochrysis_lutea.AAC.6
MAYHPPAMKLAIASERRQNDPQQQVRRRQLGREPKASAPVAVRSAPAAVRLQAQGSHQHLHVRDS